MKKLILLPLFLAIIGPDIFCQGIYFKASSNSNISISKQQMPEYFTYTINVPTGIGMSGYNINLNVKEFSIASGLNFQGTTGYSFNDFLSFELKFSIFSNSKKEFEASPQLKYASNGNTEWDFLNYSFLPTFLFGQTFNKSAINIFVYSGLGFSKLNIKASLATDFREYEFNRSYTFSWGYGLEYSYSISKNFSLFSNIGINNSNYKPAKAELISSSNSMEHMTISQKEIRYVNEITNLKLGYNGTTDTQSPEIRLKETSKLNSFFLGIGIKYTLKK
jgi:hypothetical protein